MALTFVKTSLPQLGAFLPVLRKLRNFFRELETGNCSLQPFFPRKCNNLKRLPNDHFFTGSMELNNDKGRHWPCISVTSTYMIHH